MGNRSIGLAGGDECIVSPEAEGDLVGKLVKLIVFSRGEAGWIMWVAKQKLARFFRTERDSA